MRNSSAVMFKLGIPSRRAADPVSVPPVGLARHKLLIIVIHGARFMIEMLAQRGPGGLVRRQEDHADGVLAGGWEFRVEQFLGLGPHKGIGHPKQQGKIFAAEELFDLQSDPQELDNLAESPELAQIKEQLSQKMDLWIL